MSGRLLLLIIVVFIGLLGSFILQNAHTVEVKFLFWSFNSALTIVISISVIVGMVVGVIASLFTEKKKK